MEHNLSTNRLVLTTLLLFLALLVFGCKGSVKSPTKPPDKAPEWETPRENREAEEAALWLSDQLVAPEYLYNDILKHLSEIREKYDNNISQVNIHFTPPWIVTELILMVTQEAKEQIRSGQYHDLDSLNTVFRLLEMDTTLLRCCSILLLNFEGRYHPYHLSKFYDTIQSVVYADPNHRGGDRSNVYPWFIGNGLSYLFREAWGDCPSGCIYSRYWYFEVTRYYGLKYVGSWDPQEEPEPNWWWKAKRGMAHYRGF